MNDLLKLKNAKEKLLMEEVINGENLTSKNKKELESLAVQYMNSFPEFKLTKENRGIHLNEFFNNFKGSRLIIIRHKGKPIGLTSFNHTSKGAQLELTVVDKKYRGLKLGQKLNAKRLYQIRIEGRKKIMQGPTINKSGKKLKEKRIDQWKRIKQIPQSVFDRVKKRRRV